MWLGELSRASWGCLVAAQREAAARGAVQIASDHLLLGLVNDGPRDVIEALHESGIAPVDIQAAIGAATMELGTAALTEISPDAETRTIAQRALAEASSREHVDIEPGHLLLALMSCSASSGCQLLVHLGADLKLLRERVVEKLTPKVIDASFLRRSSERFPRLTADQTQELAEEVAAWREAARLLAEEHDTLSHAAREQLVGVRADTREAWLRLQGHHAHLVWAAAKRCADQGHDLQYAFGVATKALTGACFSFDPWEEVPFEEYARSQVADSMEAVLGCSET